MSSAIIKHIGEERLELGLIWNVLGCKQYIGTRMLLLKMVSITLIQIIRIGSKNNGNERGLSASVKVHTRCHHFSSGTAKPRSWWNNWIFEILDF